MAIKTFNTINTNFQVKCCKGKCKCYRWTIKNSSDISSILQVVYMYITVS